MPELTLYASKSALIRKDLPNQNFSTASSEELTQDYRQNKTVRQLLVGFDPADYASIKYKKLMGAEISAYTTYKHDSSAFGQFLCYGALKDEFDESAVTYNNAPKNFPLTLKRENENYANDTYIAHIFKSSVILGTSAAGTGSIYATYSRGTSELEYPLLLSRLAEGIRNGIAVGEYYGDAFNTSTNAYECIVQTSRGTNVPKVKVIYADDSAAPELAGMSPASGYIPKNTTHRFSWGTVEKDFCIAGIKQTSATLYYRNSSSGSYSSVSVSGTNEYCDLSGSNITGDVFQWYVTVNYDTGATLTSDVFTLTTIEATSNARILAPKNALIDARMENVFSWEHIISTGTMPFGALAQYSEDEITWNTITMTLADDKLSGTVPANFFSAGQYYWRVATYNTDGAIGQNSDSASFVVISAPPIPTLTVNVNSGKPIVNWQSSDQQGWQLTVDDNFDTGAQYGTINSYTVPTYLTQGQHTFRLRIQNKYGMWSDNAIAIVSVQPSGSAVTLTASSGDNGVSLSWTAANSSYYSGGFYVVFRDNVPIAKVEYSVSPSYTDTLAAGQHSYKILGVKNASYAFSNAVELVAESKELQIADIETLSWISLNYSTTTFSDKRFTMSQVSASRYITAAEYPVIEVSKHKLKAVTFTTAFINETAAADFESLFGKLVAVKAGRECIIGVLTALQKTKSIFYVGYSCSVNQITYDEGIEL